MLLSKGPPPLGGCEVLPHTLPPGWAWLAVAQVSLVAFHLSGGLLGSGLSWAVLHQVGSARLWLGSRPQTVVVADLEAPPGSLATAPSIWIGRSKRPVGLCPSWLSAGWIIIAR